MTIELKKVVVSFGATELFSTDYLLIPEGSHVGVVGDNGSGKSTLFSLIAGSIKPESGSVYRDHEVAVIQQLTDQETSKSGGEQTKQKISAALNQSRGILLADEPTNHLDQKGIVFLERKLQAYQGTVLVISHNRSFLNQTVSKILEIEQGRLTLFEGNYDAYFAQKEQIKLAQAKAYDNYQKERYQIEQAMRTVSTKSAKTRKTPRRMGNSEARLHKMGNQRAKKSLDNKAKALNSRLDQLTKVEKIRTKKKLVIPLTSQQALHKKIVIEAKNFNLSLGSKTLLFDSQFKLLTGSKTALLGENGAGKTTLLKAIMVKNPAISCSYGVEIGYFSQTFEQLDEEQTVFENVKNTSLQTEQVIRDVLAHMQFRGTSILKKVGLLSGGERNKVVISQLLLGTYNVLLLDEPTNHLDLASIKVLEEALCAYQGTILFTSHDPYFVQKVATEKWCIDQQKIVLTTGAPQLAQGQEQQLQERLLWENRKTAVLSELTFADEERKQILEEEFQQVLQHLKKLEMLDL